MINRIGYACINTSLEDNFRDCRLNSIYKNGLDFLKDIIIHNLNLTKEILLWNIDHGILMYRATSKLIPFATHEGIINDFAFVWNEDKDILKCLTEIKSVVNENNIRLSMHPDHFTVLNSPNDSVIENSILNLEYHRDIISLMGGTDLIIHTGGVYGDKKESGQRFIDNYLSLDQSIRKYLRLENDDVSYSLSDVINISKKCSIPLVLDIHHHYCNNEILAVEGLLPDVTASWDGTGLIPKCHISTGISGYRDKRHDDFLSPSDFFSFLEITKDVDIDLMVEAKAKEQAVLNLMKLVKL